MLQRRQADLCNIVGTDDGEADWLGIDDEVCPLLGMLDGIVAKGAFNHSEVLSADPLVDQSLRRGHSEREVLC